MLKSTSNQDLINLSNAFLKCYQLTSTLNIGFINITESVNTIETSSFLNFSNSFLLLSQTIDPLYTPIILTLDTLSSAFHNIYKASQDVSYSSFNFKNESNSFDINLKNIIFNFNLLSNELVYISSIIEILGIINLEEIINAASNAIYEIALQFSNLNYNITLIKINFSVFSIAFQQAYVVTAYLSNIPSQINNTPLSNAFNNIYNDFINISLLFNDVKYSPYSFASQGLIQIIQIAYNQLGYTFKYLSNASSNTELFNGLYYNSYIDNMVDNIYDLLISELAITYVYSVPAHPSDITAVISNYVKDISSNLSIIIDNIDNIEYIINSPNSLKNVLSSIQITFNNIVYAFSLGYTIKSSSDLTSYLLNINFYHYEIFNGFNLAYSTVLYIVPESLNLTYPNINSNENFANLFNNASIYLQNISQNYESMVLSFGKTTLQGNFFQNIVNSFHILSQIFENASVKLFNLTIQELYVCFYQIYNMYNNISLLFTSLFNNLNLIENITIPINIDISNNYNNLSNIFNSIVDLIPSLNIPNSSNLILSFQFIANNNLNLSKIFNMENPFYTLITYLYITYKQSTQIWNDILVIISYISVDVPVLSISTSLSSSLLSASNACKNIAISYLSLEKIIPNNLIFNYDFLIINYYTLSSIFNNASNSLSSSELLLAFKQINIILNNQNNNVLKDVFSIIPIRNIYQNNIQILYGLNNLITNYNLLSSSLLSASNSINILQFNIDHPIEFSVSLNVISQSILEISTDYNSLISTLSSSSQDSLNVIKNITDSMSNLYISANQLYTSIEIISPEKFTSVLAINAPF